MISTGFLKNVARIGSQQYQQQFCVHGTSAEYVLLDELLETTIYSAKHKAETSNLISQHEKDALIKFHVIADRLFDRIPWQDANYSIEQIVDCNESMKQIRDAAMDCLHDLGATIGWDELLEW